jgi:anthranilate 1,2-dioxygenase small subunit/terephthalate 1,2-dioxygenase oxygenase component beta subunit
MAFHAAYAQSIDSDQLESWPDFFTPDTVYRVTHIENEQENLPAGIVWADSRAMLEDRVAALREANIYERQRYRHLIGIPLILSANAETAQATTPFMVARIMATGETQLFATGVFRDRFVKVNGRLFLAERVAVCDSTVTDTLMALPL